jgi:hypothetical protein
MGEEWPIDELFDEDYLHFYTGRVAETSDEEASTIWSLLAWPTGSSSTSARSTR